MKGKVESVPLSPKFCKTCYRIYGRIIIGPNAEWEGTFNRVKKYGLTGPYVTQTSQKQISELNLITPECQNLPYMSHQKEKRSMGDFESQD